jgi:hypothetical protein
MTIPNNNMSVKWLDGITPDTGTLALGTNFRKEFERLYENDNVLDNAKFDKAGGSLTGDLLLGGNFTQSGNGTFATGTGAVSLRGHVTIGTNADRKNLTLNGNFSQSGAGTFSTGEGRVSLNGNVTIGGWGTPRILEVHGEGLFYNNLYQSGNSEFSTGAGNVYLNGEVLIACDKNLNVGGDANILGNLHIKQEINFHREDYSFWWSNSHNNGFISSSRGIGLYIGTDYDRWYHSDCCCNASDHVLTILEGSTGSSLHCLGNVRFDRGLEVEDVVIRNCISVDNCASFGTVDIWGDATLHADVTIANNRNLIVSGNTQLNNLSVEGTFRFDNLDVEGNTQLNNLSVDGAFRLKGLDIRTFIRTVAASSASATANGENAGSVRLAADNDTTSRSMAATPAGVMARITALGNLAPRPRTADTGVGRWISLDGQPDLPVGGTWAYFTFSWQTIGSGFSMVESGVNVAAGGSQVLSVLTANNVFGFAWRIS